MDLDGAIGKKPENLQLPHCRFYSSFVPIKLMKATQAFGASIRKLLICSSVPRDAQIEPITEEKERTGERAVDEEGDEEDAEGDFVTDKQYEEYLGHYEESPRLSPTALNLGRRGAIRASALPLRNAPVTTDSLSLDVYMHADLKLNPKSYVELDDGRFLRIVHIIRNSFTSELTLRGLIFRRTRDMEGIFDKKKNEVCMILHVDSDDPRDPQLQAMESVPMSEVKKRRRIRVTNRPFPELSYRDDTTESDEMVENERVLVCRWKYICFYPNAQARHRLAFREKATLRIRADECDNGHDSRKEDSKLRETWRGRIMKGGACSNWMTGEKEFLRQELLSNRGVASRQSLVSPVLGEFPQGDIMLRGCVGPLVMKKGLSSYLSEANAANHTFQPITTSLAVPAIEQHRSQTIPHILPPKISPMEDNDPAWKEMRFPYKRPSVISESWQTSPVVVERDAQVKTSSEQWGTFRVHHEERITSTYTPKSSVCSRKRSADDSFILSSHTMKRANRAQENTQNSARRSIGSKSSPIQPASHTTDSDVKSSVIDFTMPHYNHASSRSVDRYKNELPHTIDPLSSIDLTVPMPHFRALSISKHNKRKTSMPSHNAQKQSSLGIEALSRRSSPGSSRNPNDYAQKDLIESPLTLLGDDSRWSPSKASIVTQQPQSRQKVPPRRYTVGDCFCGAGGMSRGAVMAGLRVVFGFDSDLPACESYGRNNYGTTVYNLKAHVLLKLGDHIVDILHLSPPCQFFSPAHTTVGKDDEKNTASMFAIGQLLDNSKPRIVTMEETAGLLSKHLVYFNATINMFTSRGYSIRWAILNCADFGLPQRRLRLFIIASCPGEPLPEFPKPTHAQHPEGTGLKPWVTINQAINKIPAGWYNHDIEGTATRNKPPHSGDKVANCITTSGGGNVHPSGTRSFTHREFACLQLFPLGHKFGKVGIRKQIGNAVPPGVAKIIFEQIKTSLLREDGLL